MNEPNIPKVIIKRKKAKKTIENWLGNPSSPRKTSSRFGILLQQAGIPSTETCILEQSKENALAFNCHLKNQRKNISISLIFEDVDNFGDLIITTETERRTYEYHKETRNEEMKLILRNEKLNTDRSKQEHYFNNNQRKLYPYLSEILSQNKQAQRREKEKVKQAKKVRTLN